ncbi:3-oxoacyl-[acyl-carrier-protein] synthase 3 [Clostridia bacterium]|nr:3-oxoacyl-[acyl-carrier-protein] synthase 3 [Clostridia bacterium]
MTDNSYRPVASIVGTGIYLPELVLANDDFKQCIDTSDEWIYTRTGIKTRRVEQKLFTFEMIANACINALADADVNASDVDMLIVSTISGDYAYPSAACLAAEKIGAYNANAFDVSAACAGFIYSLELADLYIKSGKAKTVLCAAGDTLSRFTDYYDRANCILFGDAAGAAVVSASADGHIVKSIYTACDCNEGKPLSIYAKQRDPHVFFDPLTKAFVGNSKFSDDCFIKMNGREVFAFAVKAMPKAMEEAAKSAGITVSDADFIVAHQANKRILDAVINKYNIDPAKLPMTISKYGNTSSSSVPIALDEIAHDGTLKRGDKVILTGFGAGLTYGAAVVDW